MNASANSPGSRRDQEIREKLEDLARALTKLRDVRPHINDEDIQGQLDLLITAAAGMIEAHIEGPGPSLPTQARDLRRGVTELVIPSSDPVLGPTETLERAQAAQGIFSTRLDRLTSLLPGTPANSGLVPRADVGQATERIEARLDSLEVSLRALRDTNEAKPGTVQQSGLINLYIKDVKAEISLARFLAKIGDSKLDLGAIQAAAQRLAGLTQDFVTMVASWAGRISDWLPPLGEWLRRGAAGVVKAVALGWRVVGWRRAREAPPVQQDSKEIRPVQPDVQEVRRRLLYGEAIPTEWVQAITEVDLSRSWFSQTERLAALANLQSLSLGGTRITNTAPLGALKKLRTLSIGGTQIDDIAPVAVLSNLQSLSLGGTQISDIAPLANLPDLRNLDLRDTHITNIVPLAVLARLQSLNLWGTWVRDISPLAALANLTSLDLTNVPITDISPLDALTKLQRLAFRNTEVSDISPLTAFTSLRMLDLAGTHVRDIAMLARLTKLESLDLMNTPVADIRPLAALVNLQKLNLWDTSVCDITPLTALESLEDLHLSHEDVAGIAELKRHRPGLTIRVSSEDT